MDGGGFPLLGGLFVSLLFCQRDCYIIRLSDGGRTETTKRPKIMIFRNLHYIVPISFVPRLYISFQLLDEVIIEVCVIVGCFFHLRKRQKVLGSMNL